MSERKYVTATDIEHRLGLPAGSVSECVAQELHRQAVEIDRQIAEVEMSMGPDLCIMPPTREVKSPCRHCGYEIAPFDERRKFCPARDGDLCERKGETT
jgi:predicted Zn-ribbon and HTH transcriptional regulator